MERNYLKEAFEIIFDKTIMLTQKEHLQALYSHYHEKLNQMDLKIFKILEDTKK